MKCSMHLVCVSISQPLDGIVRPFSRHNFPLRILTLKFAAEVFVFSEALHVNDHGLGHPF